MANYRIFIRGQAMYEVRLPNKVENYLVKTLRETGCILIPVTGDIGTGIPAYLDADTRCGHGLSVKFAVGFRFYNLPPSR